MVGAKAVVIDFGEYRRRKESEKLERRGKAASSPFLWAPFPVFFPTPGVVMLPFFPAAAFAGATGKKN